MAYVMVDIESDGPIPGDYSMVCFGAVIVEAALRRTFYGKLKPISDKWIPGALEVSGFSREDVMAFDDPAEVMLQGSHESPVASPSKRAADPEFRWSVYLRISGTAVLDVAASVEKKAKLLRGPVAKPPWV